MTKMAFNKFLHLYTLLFLKYIVHVQKFGWSRIMHLAAKYYWGTCRSFEEVDGKLMIFTT